MDNQEWNFEAPKFWDLLETIPQERPTDAWFCKLSKLALTQTRLLITH
jgi:hypothetical protein